MEMHGIGFGKVFYAAVLYVSVFGIKNGGIGNALEIDIDDLEKEVFGIDKILGGPDIGIIIGLNARILAG